MAEVAATSSPQAQASTESGRGRRGGRGGRGRGRGNRNPALALRPSQVTPPATATSTPATSAPQSEAAIDPSQNNNPSGRSRRPRRGGHGTGRGRNERVVEQREFGGTLTSAEPPAAVSTADALGDGGATQAGSTRPRKLPEGRRRRLSRSTAPDIATRTHEDIDNGNYECPICTSEVRRNSKVWSCHTCWTVFHLGCIKQWAANSEAQAREQAERSGTNPGPQPWRCPGCNLPQETKRLDYSCWCGKDQDPRSITGLPPHSCGQTCGKERVLPKRCPHGCELLCHAGPCPPCSHMGPLQSCFCGKQETKKKCIETEYEAGWSCGEICGESLPCGDHECQRPCHEGLCGACEVRIDARCYCGKEEKAILCCDKDDEKTSTRGYIGGDGQAIIETWNATFTCASICERLFDCGKHACQQPCHSANEAHTHCPKSPDVVTHCPCGKTGLDELLKSPRLSCEDAIPNCAKKCLKELQCGHACQQPCHTGRCLPCLETTKITCRCSRTTLSTICHQGHEEQPQCMRTCHATLNCGRHACGERCCPGERKAVERLASKKKGRPLGSARPVAEDFEAEHICTRICGRTLKCGNHDCQELCHKGPCGACREAIFDEVPCNCGRTVLQPPLPCGTRPPPCRWDCERPKACGHPQVQHNCHLEDEPCPKCPFLTSKRCVCGKSTMKNQPCWLADPHCGLVCGEKLKCGIHACRKTCHKTGECEDKDSKCTQTCGRPKKLCGHPCEETCHAPYPCTQDRPCTAKKIITCACQHKKTEIKCGASAKSQTTSLPERTLECDEECARLARNRVLASALEVDPATRTDEHVPYANETLATFKNMNNTRFTTEVENALRAFAADDSVMRHRFKPMKAPERAFVHALAEDFGLDSESMDPEPHRHVALFKTPRFVGAPMKTLRDALRIRQAQAARMQPDSADRSHAQPPATKTAPSALTTDEPFNGFVLSQPRFGLTLDELAAETAAAALPFSLAPHFQGTGDVAMLAPSANESTLRDAKSALARAFNRAGTGASLQLARVAPDGSRVVFRESDLPPTTNPAAGGWSQVAAKSAAARPPPAQAGVGAKSTFTVLASASARRGDADLLSAGAGAGLGVGRKKEKKARRERERAEASVVEDWEAEMDRQDRIDMADGAGGVAVDASGGGGAEEHSAGNG